VKHIREIIVQITAKSNAILFSQDDLLILLLQYFSLV